jgi:hypothetical protein
MGQQFRLCAKRNIKRRWKFVPRLTWHVMKKRLWGESEKLLFLNIRIWWQQVWGGGPFVIESYIFWQRFHIGFFNHIHYDLVHFINTQHHNTVFIFFKLTVFVFDICLTVHLWYNPYPTAFPYGKGMVLHFYQQQESSTTKTVHKVINKGLKANV